MWTVNDLPPLREKIYVLKLRILTLYSFLSAAVFISADTGEICARMRPRFTGRYKGVK